QYVQDGYGGTNGLTSTVRDTSGSATTLVPIDNNDIGGAYTEWPIGSGLTIDTDTVFAKYTYFGDANLDGKVTGDDYTVLDAGLNTGAYPLSFSWLAGDMTGDGQVTGDDYTLLDANLGQGTANPLSASGNGLQSVPEPASVMLAAMGIGYVASRRRRVGA